MTEFTIHIAGDSALNLQFAQEISPETSTMIRVAAENLAEHHIPGITETVPTFCSLMVCYDPLIIGYDELVKYLTFTLQDIGIPRKQKRRIVEIPVCYGGEFGPDLPNVAKHAGISEQEVIKLHTQSDYLIDMLGFMPGFAYLGGLDNRIHTPRLDIPRTRIPAGSVGIGGAQTGIYPLESPGGWQLIGRSPIRPYDPLRKEPILYEAGDYLRFVSISEEEYNNIEARIAADSYTYIISVED